MHALLGSCGCEAGALLESSVRGASCCSAQSHHEGRRPDGAHAPGLLGCGAVQGGQAAIDAVIQLWYSTAVTSAQGRRAMELLAGAFGVAGGLQSGQQEVASARLLKPGGRPGGCQGQLVGEGRCPWQMAAATGNSTLLRFPVRIFAAADGPMPQQQQHARKISPCQLPPQMAPLPRWTGRTWRWGGQRAL